MAIEAQDLAGPPTSEQPSGFAQAAEIPPSVEPGATATPSAEEEIDFGAVREAADISSNERAASEEPSNTEADRVVEAIEKNKVGPEPAITGAQKAATVDNQPGVEPQRNPTEFVNRAMNEAPEPISPAAQPNFAQKPADATPEAPKKWWQRFRLGKK